MGARRPLRGRQDPVLKEHAAYQKAFVERDLPTYSRNTRLETWYDDGLEDFVRVLAGVQGGPLHLES